MSFSADYVPARRRFRDGARRLGWTTDQCPIEARDAGDLTIDVAISPSISADTVLVVSSGLHGIEGPFGSAVQAACLERWHDAPGPLANVRCVFLHALNPFGFATSRRFDGDNVDVNRNFMDWDAAPSGGSELYRRFDPLLNPRRAPSRWDTFRARGLWYIARYGRPALKQALVTGQYDFPKGLFFGGHGPSPTLQALQSRMGAWIGRAGQVVHLDFHTGLGVWATYKLITDTPLGDAQRQRLTRWFGAGSFEEHDPRGVAYRARGSFGQWCVARRFAPDYLFLFAEFGTYGNLSVLAGLRAENQAHHWGRPDDAATIRAKRRLRDLFYPSSTEWRSRTLAAGVALVEGAARGLHDGIDHRSIDDR